MEQKLVWRCRVPGPLEMVAEVVQVGEGLLYRKLFDGEMVKSVSITPELAGDLFFGLVALGWHTE